MSESGAVISECGRYRYALRRVWGREGTTCMFICLNPSTADATMDDPTVRRCIGFSRDWGFDQMLLGNLFALRSTNPAALRGADDPIGPENDKHLRRMAFDADLVVAAWGSNAMARDRSTKVKEMIPGMACLGFTKSGQPKHPLYLRKDSELIDVRGLINA